MEVAEEFHQIRMRFTDPLQHDYEVIRPIMLFAERVSERSRQVEMDRSVVGEKAKRFVREGMLGLQDQRSGHSGRKPHDYPEAVVRGILYLKQRYPPIHYREIVRIIERKYGYRTNHHTVARFLEHYPIPVQLELDMKGFHEFEDAYQARWTVVRMYYEGWNKKSIAGCLRLSRYHVENIVKAFEKDGFSGLEDHRHRAANHPTTQLTLPLFKEVLEIQQEYPRAGRFRIHALLQQKRGEPIASESTIGRAMRHNRQFHGAPPAWIRKVRAEANAFKHLPYRPVYRHQMWFIDVRYLVKLDGRWVYSICILEGYSRQILAGMASFYQDLTAILQILHAALREFGSPEQIISDNAGVFRATEYLRLLKVLDIQSHRIERKKPWQNLIEAQFKIQLRLADAKFEQATTLTTFETLHAEFVQTFNTTSHWAHRERPDERHTPAEVLDWVRGRDITPTDLHALVGGVQVKRYVNRHGFVSIQRFYVYAERGLSRQRVSVWIYEGHLHLEYESARLADYRCDYRRDTKTLASLSHPRLYRTLHASPQLELFELDNAQWHKIAHRTYLKRIQRQLLPVVQLPLAGIGVFTLFWTHHYLEEFIALLLASRSA